MPVFRSKRRSADGDLERGSTAPAAQGGGLRRQVLGLQSAAGNRAVAQLLRRPAGAPAVQREVTNVWGKWRSSLDPSRNFATKEEAMTWEAAQPKAVAATPQPVLAGVGGGGGGGGGGGPAVTYSWNIRPSARKHYNDGWGAKYNIRTDEALKQAVLDDGQEDEDEFDIDLGVHKVKSDTSGCNIKYENIWVGNSCTTRVWHCGPTLFS